MTASLVVDDDRLLDVGNRHLCADGLAGASA